jgi:hypothetical protein
LQQLKDVFPAGSYIEENGKWHKTYDLPGLCKLFGELTISGKQKVKCQLFNF